MCITEVSPYSESTSSTSYPSWWLGATLMVVTVVQLLNLLASEHSLFIVKVCACVVLLFFVAKFKHALDCYRFC